MRVRFSRTAKMLIFFSPRSGLGCETSTDPSDDLHASDEFDNKRERSSLQSRNKYVCIKIVIILFAYKVRHAEFATLERLVFSVD